MSTLLLVACYGGERRCTPQAYELDHSLFLRQWADALTRTEPAADVCFVSNGGDETYTAYLDVLRGQYQVIDRENTGHSQGAWDAGWRQNPGYGYYIVAEDDYIPVLKHFDTVMTGMLDAIPGCGYLCQYLWNGQVPMMNGVLTAATLEKTGGFPFAAARGQQAADHGQAMLGTVLREQGVMVCDMGGRFRLPYMMNGFLPGETAGGTGVFFPEAAETLLVPAQVYEAELAR